jgi:hypothetical protein
MMEFSPLSALEMCATPHGPATICTACVSTPAAFSPESSLSVKRSVPRDAIMSTARTQLGDGHRLVGALASVEHIEAAAENGLARGREAVAHATRSILMLPTTNNLFSTFFPHLATLAADGKDIVQDLRFLEDGGAGRNRTSIKRLCRPSPDRLGSAPF